MSGLVSGYSGIIAPPNLATNGAFGIHQRGNHGFIPFKSGDYVADCWFINNPTDVDYLEVWHSVPNDGSVNKAIYRGYGKKGQQINIKCRDDSPYGEHFTMLTSQANVYPYGAEKSVPLKVDCLPKRDHSYSNVLNESKILYNSNDYVSVVGIVENTSTDGLMYGGFVRLYLQEDGEFSFIINNYTELAGAFKNPPKYAPVPYADDLARCQRYYQRINVQDHYGVYPQALIHYNGDSRVVHDYILPTQMATDASPVLIRHAEDVTEYSVSSGLGTTTNFSTKYPTFFGRVKGGRKVRFYLHRSSQDTSVTAMVASYTLELEIV